MPFVLAVEMPCGNDDGELRESRRKTRVVAQVLAEMLYAVGQLGHVYQRQKRPSHAAPGPGSDGVVDLALVGIQLGGIDGWKTAHVAGFLEM